MATAFTHVLVSTALGGAIFGFRGRARLLAVAAVCSAAPDLDVGLHAYGVAYADPWGHRGISHSLLFAVGVGLLAATLPFFREAPPGGRRWWGLVAFFTAITASHGLIDGFTDGGHGIAYFAPFTHERFFMPWRPLAVSPFGLAFFTDYGLEVMATEFLWVWIPTGALALGIVAIRPRPFRPPARAT